jgi:hypothetical protein
MRLNRWVVLGLGLFGLSACNDMSMPNDLVKLQEQQRDMRRPPSATELPPGLGPDLPDTPGPGQPPKVTANENGGT